LYDRISHEFDDEKGHATKLIDRMLFLGGRPDMTTRTGLQIGVEVPDMLESDLRVEYEVAAKLKEVIAICETEKDYVTRDMLVVLLDDTEVDHAHWLEQQLGLIKRLGLQNFLQSQI
jgi:bacterioferritin